MPTALFIGPYRFFFWSYDCDEPPHMHVQHDRMQAKFWLEPVHMANNHGFRDRELREIKRLIDENLEQLRSEWNEHCNGA